MFTKRLNDRRSLYWTPACHAYYFWVRICCSSDVRLRIIS